MSSKKIQSVIALFEEMKKAERSYSESYEWIYLHCSSQSDLAGIVRKSKCITGMTLNTFKKYCDESIDGGFKSVNNLRAKLYKKRFSKEVKKVRPQDKLRELAVRIDELERSKAILIKGYNELNTITLDLLISSKGNSFEYRKHRELYSSYFGLNLVVDNEE
ncbi:hypothetical protein [Aliivibrio fischeri]|uniref:hypothetical protein n=1 Tax=Aliivibrio fischeri TaxID=668 RepID=UPI001F16F8EC|nr:hypothetical protein [Aliivibrio fischeri]